MAVSPLRAGLTGFAMGTADLVPGVSGGTIALVAGIYDEFIGSLAAIDREALGLLVRGRFAEFARHVNLRFLAPLAVGILAAVIGLSGILHDWLEDPTARSRLFAFFFGLVAASIVSVGSHVTWTRARWAAAAGGVAVGLVIALATPARTPDTAAWAVVGGALAVSAMILPGISGSFILLLVGQYDRAIEAVAERDFATIGLFAIGAAVGLLLMVRVLQWALREHRDLTLSILVGFIAGSLPRLWPWNACPECARPEWFLPDTGPLLAGIGLALGGALVVSALEWAGRGTATTDG